MASATNTRLAWASAIALAASLLASRAGATLILDTSIAGPTGFNTLSTDTDGNDLPNAPDRVYFGQLEASAAGLVDFFYIGNEAAYTNTLHAGAASHSVGADSFAAPYNIVGTVDAYANTLLDFGFCTSGGTDLGGSNGRCAYNNDDASLLTQFNYPNDGFGYRSIGFVALSSFNAQAGTWTYAASANGPNSDLWMIFWDDSGARNDDNHDDYIAVARFRSRTVPEPGTLFLLGVGFLAIGLVRRRYAKI